MNSERETRLQIAITTIRRRWGADALRQAEDDIQPTTIAALPTGFPELDVALGIGGVPRGRITEVVGIPTSGMTTLALTLAARAQAEGATTVLVDTNWALDPDYAVRCGLNLNRLLLVRPRSGDVALEMVHDLVAGQGAELVVVGAPIAWPTDPAEMPKLELSLRRINRVLLRSNGVLVILTPLLLDSGTSGISSHHAAVRLLVERTGWLHEQDDIRGYPVRIMVLKNRFAPAGRTVTIEITFDDIVRGDGA